ncbi:MAG: hypothetical protein GF418_17160 [Chitinivibrionales bacterium]|nr:hypothetical protein [Chitinivibrionales bacterium]MBD3397349.1 hypothetical protein [Chitinivibrionales bacterium]
MTNPVTFRMRAVRIVVQLVLAAVLLACGCRGLIHAKKTFFRMDTVVHVTIVAPRGADLDTVWQGLDSLLESWEQRFSPYHAASEVRALNERTADSTRITPTLAAMLETGLAYGDTLDGGFDVTILPVKDVWGFGVPAGPKGIPSPQDLAAALRRVDYQRVKVDREAGVAYFDDAGVVVDVGGVAKGYALRAAGRHLVRAGFDNWLVSAGGDILSRGKRHDNRPWRIGIQHPRDPDSLLTTVTLDSGSVVTSGDYERCWEKDGVRYHHIFDPRSGTCCRRNQSLTVWSMDPVEADIVSTGLFCRAYGDILAFVNARPRLACVVVDSAGEMHASRVWQDRMQ